METRAYLSDDIHHVPVASARLKVTNFSLEINRLNSTQEAEAGG